MDTNKMPPEGLALKKKPRLTAMERLAIETGLDAGKMPYDLMAQKFGVEFADLFNIRRIPSNDVVLRSHPNSARTRRKTITLTNSERLNAKSVKVNAHPKVNAHKIWVFT